MRSGIRVFSIAGILLIAQVGLLEGDPATRHAIGTITLLARRDIGIGRRIAIKVVPPQQENETKRRVMEFSVDDDARIAGRYGPVPFSSLTLGLLVRVGYIEGLNGQLTATMIRVQFSDEADSVEDAVSL